MSKHIILAVFFVPAVLVFSGCGVQRRLTIVTDPPEAVVWLNDEEIGVSPVTVNFNWYGHYRVRIEKPGYQILNVNRELESPAHDRFPLDFFAEVLWPRRIEDDYTWQFALIPFVPATSEELIERAAVMRARTELEVGRTAAEILTEEAP